MSGGVTRRRFGTLSSGETVEAVDLTGDGIAVTVIGWGAAIQSLSVPDREGTMADVVLAYDDIGQYEAKPQYFGASIGRFANRIAGGRFTLDGRTYTLDRNNGPNCLHGGKAGFSERNWTIATVEDGETPAVVFRLVSEDGDGGFPGRLDVGVRYAITAPGELSVSFEATTDAPTVVNLTNHSYFNLAGVHGTGDILGHELTLAADAYLPVDANLIPTGERAPVEGTPFDFRTARCFGERVREGSDPQLSLARGYDHCVVLDGGETAAPKRAAIARDPIERPDAGAPHHRARPAGLFRQLPRRDVERQGRPDDPPVRRLLSRAAALSRCAEPAGFSHRAA